MTDLKTSILVNRQLPEFIREEYPQFIAFIEAYYEFLETQQGTQKNDLTNKLKDARYFTDVDESLDLFEEQFFKTFLPYFDQKTQVSKDFLIKNVLPFYLSKGSEQSFKFLFKLLFNEEPTIFYPKDFILRASDGRWVIPNVLRIYNDIKSIHIADGTNSIFIIAPINSSSKIQVFVNDVLQEENIDYFVRKEYSKLYFYNVPNENDIIRVKYLNFDLNLLKNRQIIGQVSKIETIIEDIVFRRIGVDNFYEIYLPTNFDKTFVNSEVVNSLLFVNDVLVKIELRTLSDVSNITVIDGGANYNVGDPVLLTGPSFISTNGRIERVDVVFGGAGFQVGNEVVSAQTGNTLFDSFVISTNTEIKNVLQETFINNDIIKNYANVFLNSANYNFPSENVLNENINTVISDALTNIKIDSLAPIGCIAVNTSNIFTGTEILPLNVLSPIVINEPTSNSFFRISDYGIIGRIEIVKGGRFYEVGDTLTFTNIDTENFYSRGAQGIVSEVSDRGSIVEIQILNGGLGYSSNQLPIVTVNSQRGIGAALRVTSILGDNEIINGRAVEERGSFLRTAKAVVGSITSGTIESLNVVFGGAGFQVGNKVVSTDSGELFFDAFVQTVFPGEKATLNQISINNDFITDYLNVALNSPDYGFPSQVVSGQNINTLISDALTTVDLDTLGPITSVTVNSSQLKDGTEFEALPPVIIDNPNLNIFKRLNDFGIIGRINIIDGGFNYNVGDTLTFTNIDTDNFFSRGAEAVVSEVSETGSIIDINIINGGFDYSKDEFPIITVNSVNGVGAILEVSTLMGEGEVLEGLLSEDPVGKITSIKLLDPGVGYVFPPLVSLTDYGNGQATANVTIRDSQIKLPGRWLTTDSLLSSDRFLQGQDYYTDFTYVISSKIEFSRYKELFKQLIHPAGFKQFAKFEIKNNLQYSNVKKPDFTSTIRQVAGTVSTTDNLYELSGVNTYFEVANTIDLLTEGTYILVNSEIRIVNSIINNTTITVSDPFEFSLNNELITLVTVPYRSITTEYWREITNEDPEMILLVTEEDY